MLGVSIQSVLESDPSVNIMLFTADKEVERRVKHDFPQVEIRFLSKEAYCDRKNFTCAGHARIQTIFDTLQEFKDDVLYVDNDTITYPDGIGKLQKSDKPMGYSQEPWNSVGNWVDNFPCMKQEIAKQTGHAMLLKPTINNGVQYFPYNKLSLQLAERVKELYDHLLKTCGYYYGLDMSAYSVALHQLQLADSLCFRKKQTSTVWHAYMVKYNYLQNLKQAGVRVDPKGFVQGHKEVFKKLREFSDMPSRNHKKPK